MTFAKHDDDKLPMHLLPHGALEMVARVLDHGAKKYSAHGWRNVDMRSRYYSAALRHMVSWWRGENRDAESGLPHLAHAACCLLFLCEAEIDDLGEDDRP